MQDIVLKYNIDTVYNETKVSFASTSKIPMQLVSRSKNQENIDRIISALEDRLTQIGSDSK